MTCRFLKITLIFLCFYSVSTFALPVFKRTYDIEVIVFSHITQQALQTEQWPVISDNHNVNIASMKTIPTHSLSHEAETLMHDPQYKILLHTAWQATWNGDGSTISIPIAADTLNGLMTIRLSHYFDAHINLMLTKPMAELQKLDTKNYFTSMKAPNFTFQLKQEQRMRSDELNYVGNPLMGLLIKIMPVK